MANIPYGYRIENGCAIPDPEKVKKFNDFIHEYLNGASLKDARELSGVELCVNSLNTYLKKGTYQGTDYYPPIVPMGTYKRIMAERDRRSHKGNRHIPEDLPVKRHFRMEKAEKIRNGNASELASSLYSMIIPAEDGCEKILPKELEMIKGWAQNRLSAEERKKTRKKQTAL